MKPVVIITVALLVVGGVMLVALRQPPQNDSLPMAHEVPASAVVYIGITDVHSPRPTLIDRLLGPDRMKEFEKLITPEIRSAAIYATLEEGQLRWGAVGRVHGVTVRRSWGAQPLNGEPRFGSRPEVRNAWSGAAPCNVRVWIDLAALEFHWPTDDFRALALNAEGDTAKGIALYEPKSAQSYLEKSSEHGRTGILPGASFAAAGIENFETIASRIGMEDHPHDAFGPHWGCVLRGENLVVFVEAVQPVRAREAVERIGRKNYRAVENWVLWSNNPEALDGFVPKLEGNEQGAVRFRPEAAPALERLAERYGIRLRVPLSKFGALDAKVRYLSGTAELEITFR